ncbi:hypothetical protein H6F74_09605 [Trichocoleus sp. FACHB-90]|uniref:hypothetical protein n=1 Tax=Cyanophyceae TaxID=3028117 RepID=UPI001687A2AF|nr:hypothetical protein [Trichocoleus sp. FACHB-90]MBD1926497.1 hypothetical protein [Trichocoleus sp. FACHB-90]
MADFEVGFPDGQYISHGVDLPTALKLADVFHRGGDPQSIIDAIEDEEVRTVAQRISDRLSTHSARGKGA